MHVCVPPAPLTSTPQGRTCSLRKKLRDLADWVFVDAPHTLPHYIKYDRARSCSSRAAAAAAAAAAVTAFQTGSAHDGEDEQEEGVAEDHEPGVEGEAGVGGLDHGFGISPPASPGAALAPLVVELLSPGRRGGDGGGGGGGPAVLPPGAARRAWLVSPQLLHPGSGAGAGVGGAAGGWREAPDFVDEQQYTQQTEGWAESLAALRRAVREQGPFDGVFGFSQVCACLCVRVGGPLL